MRVDRGISMWILKLLWSLIKRLWAPLNRYLTVQYLKRRGVVWEGELPSMDMLRPPMFWIQGELKLGSGAKFFTHLGPILIQVDKGATITIGKNARIGGKGTWIRARKKIEIGDDVLIGPGVTILDAHLHPVDERDMQEALPVKIGKNVWLAKGSSVLAGVEIGDHSVLSINSIARKKVSPRSIMAGDPLLTIGSIYCGDDWVRRDD